MKPEDPDAGDATLLSRYRTASQAPGEQPGEATRIAILAEARRLAQRQERPETLKPFDSRVVAANQPHWRRAAFGTVGAAVFAVILMVPAYRDKFSQKKQLATAPPTAARLDEQAPASVERPVPPAEKSLPSPVNAPQVDGLTRRSLARAKIAAGELSGNEAREGKALQKVTPDSQSALRQRGNTDATDAALANAAVPPSAPAPALAQANDPRRPQPTLLYVAVDQGDLARVNQLLESGAITGEPDPAGRTPLLLAVLAQRADIVRALLAHGADPNAADRSGQTPLGAARARNLADIAAALRQAGAREP